MLYVPQVDFSESEIETKVILIMQSAEENDSEERIHGVMISVPQVDFSEEGEKIKIIGKNQTKLGDIEENDTKDRSCSVMLFVPQVDFSEMNPNANADAVTTPVFGSREAKPKWPLKQIADEIREMTKNWLQEDDVANIKLEK